MTKIIGAVNSVVWGMPALILIVGVGMFLSIRTGFVQITLFPKALKKFFSLLKGEKKTDGSVSSFQALCS